jgi:hypothetical protein
MRDALGIQCEVDLGKDSQLLDTLRRLLHRPSRAWPTSQQLVPVRILYIQFVESCCLVHH